MNYRVTGYKASVGVTLRQSLDQTGILPIFVLLRGVLHIQYLISLCTLSV